MMFDYIEHKVYQFRKWFTYIRSSTVADNEIVQTVNAMCKLQDEGLQWYSFHELDGSLSIVFDNLPDSREVTVVIRDYEDEIKVRILQSCPIKTSNSYFKKTRGNKEYIDAIYSIFKPKPIAVETIENKVVFTGPECAANHFKELHKILEYTNEGR